MEYSTAEACLSHDPGPTHPDTAQRIEAIDRHLRGLYSATRVESDSPGDVDAVEAVHDPEYVEEVRRFCEDGGGRWNTDTVASPESWDAALAYTGLATWAVRNALPYGGNGRPSFAIGRPPGHHATVDDAGGFCFFNNAAVGAQHSLDHGANSVAILDWDAHHGDGTQEIFFERDDVLFLSIHEADLYPTSGDTREIGRGRGEGTTVNAPLPSGVGDADFRLVFEAVFLPMIRDFEPDLLLVSAGFDAHEADPISRLNLTTEGYGMLAELVVDVGDEVDAGVAFLLEGGYHNYGTLAESVGMVHEVFDGYRPRPEDGEVRSETRSMVSELETIHGL